MRVPPQQLAENLKRRFLPVYLLSGSESFLLEESANQIRHVALEKGAEHKRFSDTTPFWDRLKGEMQHVSLFSHHQLIELKFSKFTANDSQELLALLQNDHPDTTLLLMIEQLSKQTQQAPWFKLLEQKGAIITHWPLTGPAFATWVSHRAKQQGLVLGDESLRLLIYQTEGNCLAAYQAIMQLYWATLDNALAASPSSLAQQSQFTVFDLCEAALQHQPERIVKIVSCLKENEGSAQPLIVWAVGQMLRALIQASLQEHESAKRQALTQAGIRAPSQVLYLKMLKAQDPLHWSMLLSFLCAADKEFKSGDNASFWQRILKITVNLSKSYTHNGAFCI
ncbi:MAG: DNA polymerase III subunit delta [Candidatus Berkiella sp.]